MPSRSPSPPFTIEVVHEGKTVHTLEVPTEERPLGAQGYLLAMEGKEVLLLPHDMAPSLFPQAAEYFGGTFGP